MTQRLTFILLFYCGFNFICVDAKVCSNFLFSRELDKRLRCSIYKTMMAVNMLGCYQKCTSEMRCFSINSYSNENGTNVCELLQGTKSSLGIPNCLEWKKGSEHHELLTNEGSCSSSVPCEVEKIRKALPGNWYQLGSSAFKLFEQKKNYTEASAVCSANGGTLVTITDDDENNFITELYLQDEVSKREDQLIKDKLKPYKRWKLDGSDQDVTLLGSLAAKKDEYNRSAALHFTGTAGSYATTPAWGISTMTFSISLWVKMESMPIVQNFLYSYWYNPYIFTMGIFTDGNLYFAGRMKSNPDYELFGGLKKQIVLNKWTHYVNVWNRKTKQAIRYQDGSKVYQTEPSSASELDLPSPIRSVFDIGYKRDSNDVMKGWLRELLVFDRAVTSEEVKNIQEATTLDPRVWIGSPESYSNMAPASQPNTNCFSARAWGAYQWDEVPCDRKIKFICKKSV